MERAAADDNTRPPSAASDSLSKNLSVPFRGHVSGGLCPGKRLQLVGLIHPKPDRFYVALSCGVGSERPPEDVAVEVCVRFRERQVQRRACVGGVWGSSQSDVPFFPFIRGQPFREPSEHHGNGQQMKTRLLANSGMFNSYCWSTCTVR